MMRYLKIYLMIIKINFSLLFTYRANFYNNLVITLGWGIVSLSTIFIVSSKMTHVYTWTRPQMYLLAGMYTTLMGLFHMLFSTGMERFGRTISLGQLDTYLLTPIDTQLYLSTKFFRPLSSIRVVLGIIFVTAIITQYHFFTNPVSILMTFLLSLFGITLLYSIWFLTVTIMIWNPNLTNLIDFLYVGNNLGRYPPAIYTYSKNFFLYLLLPLGLFAAVPSEFILGRVNILEVVILLVSSVGFFLISRKFWKFALRHYVSASS